MHPLCSIQVLVFQKNMRQKLERYTVTSSIVSRKTRRFLQIKKEKRMELY